MNNIAELERDSASICIIRAGTRVDTHAILALREILRSMLHRLSWP